MARDGNLAVVLSDATNKSAQPLEIFTQLTDSEEATIAITFYVKNVIVNSSGHELLFHYGAKQQLAGQGLSDAILASDKPKCRMAFNGGALSDEFPINVAGASKSLEAKDADGRVHEFAVSTELSQTIGLQESALEDQDTVIGQNDGIYTKITTIAPQYVIVNNTPYTIALSQEGCQKSQGKGKSLLD